MMIHHFTVFHCKWLGKSKFLIPKNMIFTLFYSKITYDAMLNHLKLFHGTVYDKVF